MIDYLNALERLDVLVPRPDGGWGAVEVKLDGEELIAQGAASLSARRGVINRPAASRRACVHGSRHCDWPLRLPA